MKVRELAFRSAGCGRHSDKHRHSDSALPQRRCDVSWFPCRCGLPLISPGLLISPEYRGKKSGSDNSGPFSPAGLRSGRGNVFMRNVPNVDRAYIERNNCTPVPSSFRKSICKREQFRRLRAMRVYFMIKWKYTENVSRLKRKSASS